MASVPRNLIIKSGDSAAVALQRALGMLLALIVGSGIAVQARINGALATKLGDGVTGALISFGIGLVILLALTLILSAVRHGMGRILRALIEYRLRWWHLTGGLCGALVVTSQGLTVGMLGVAVFTVALIGGQIASSLLIDRIGIGPSGAQPINAHRMFGALLAIIAVGLALSNRFTHPTGVSLAVLPLFAGVGLAWQQAVNGKVGAAAQDAKTHNPLLSSTLPAALTNFTTGTAALLVLAGLKLINYGPHALPEQWWLYLSGPLGIVITCAMVVLVRSIGVFLLGLGMIAGQRSRGKQDRYLGWLDRYDQLVEGGQDP